MHANAKPSTNPDKDKTNFKSQNKAKLPERGINVRNDSNKTYVTCSGHMSKLAAWIIANYNN